ncbi:glycine receptor subunit alpha-2-like isoform X2 [Cydia fagiglandana]|uniref:glycine receptor subunit alpha-2-like isoform X2 n=1 Tax=Cydia fagiglandana TaxID=1458189 RepID=UPI002FEE4F4D
MWTLLVPLLALVASGGGATFGANKALLDCASQILYLEQQTYDIPSDYNRNIPPGKNTTVFIGLNVNRVSGVDENKEEITLDVFLQVSWKDPRLKVGLESIDLPWEFRQLIWTPDLYIWQLQTMRILSVLQEMASLRLYKNSTVSVSIGATITIKCEMDFVLYPLDVQTCNIDFSSYKYTSEYVRFEWREVPPWLGWRLAGGQRNQFRLPKYVVSFTTDKSKRIAQYGEGEHSAARLQMTLSRELRGYLLESYLPSSLFVIISWGSFCVIPEIVPGRMVLLVTTLLSLVTMFDTVSTNSPDALELKCIEVWLISCTIFVFLALLEYFVVLFGIRYDKSWCRRRADMRRAASAAQLAPPPLHVNHSQRLSCTPVTGTPQGGVFSPTLSVEDEGLKQQLDHQTISRDSPPMMETLGGRAAQGALARVGACIDKGIMFCGAQHGTLDRFALILFPCCFALFNIIYWTTYLSEVHRYPAK